jgi:hypothetical protein
MQRRNDRAPKEWRRRFERKIWVDFPLFRISGLEMDDLTGIAARWLRSQTSAACPNHGQGRQTERREGWWT